MTTRNRRAAWGLVAAAMLSGCAVAAEAPVVTIHTEAYPRPPYSEATYYVYEQDGKVVCTKLAVCDKYEQCDTTYHAGTFIDSQDQKTGKPANVTVAVVIPPGKRAKHQCLAKFVPGAL